MARRLSSHLTRWSPVLLIVSVLGCGASTSAPERVEVQGTVSLDSKMLESGMIRFIPTGGQNGPAAGAAIQDGIYALTKEDGPVLGPHRVEIVATNYLGFAMDDEEAMHTYLQKHGGKLPRNPVPANYNVSSTLIAEIDEGENELDFRLESKPGSPQQSR